VATTAVLAAFAGYLAPFCASCARSPQVGATLSDGGAPFVTDSGAIPYRDLGPGECLALSNNGHVLGTNGVNGAFVIDPAGNRSALPQLPDASVLPLALNSAGEIVGINSLGTDSVVFQMGGWSSIPPPDGGRWSAPLDLDELGNIVGVGTVGPVPEASAPPLQAFLMKTGAAATALPLSSASAAHRISSSGIIAGIYQTPAGTTHAFTYPISGGQLRDLGTLGGANSAAYGVNSRGDAVGVADTDAGAHHACLFTQGTSVDLGTLGGDLSDARGIDNNGNVVGNSVYTDGSIHPFLYRQGTLVDIIPTGYGMARVEMIASGLAVGWGIAADETTHCLEWSISP
jgi:probable HAF family extracellular repeat protein